jgi:hypothetical protein
MRPVHPQPPPGGQGQGGRPAVLQCSGAAPNPTAESPSGSVVGRSPTTATAGQQSAPEKLAVGEPNNRVTSAVQTGTATAASHSVHDGQAAADKAGAAVQVWLWQVGGKAAPLSGAVEELIAASMLPCHPCSPCSRS